MEELAVSSNCTTHSVMSGWNRITGNGRNVAITLPTIGMKFRRNARRPNSGAKSTPHAARITPAKTPVAAERPNLSAVVCS